jgi:hypothetical protein
MYDKHLFTDNETFNKNQIELQEDERLTSFIYGSFYRDLLELGANGFIKYKPKTITKTEKIIALNRCIDYFSRPDIEDYEKCQYMKNILDLIVN